MYEFCEVYKNFLRENTRAHYVARITLITYYETKEC